MTRSRHAAFVPHLVLALLLLPAARARAVTVSVVPPDTTVGVGDNFSLRIVTDAFPDLKAFDLIFSFDAAKLTFTGANPGDVLTGTGNPYTLFVVPDYAAPPDSAWTDGATLVGTSAGPGILAFYKFHADHVGDSPIQCELVDFRDSNNVRTLPACVSGIVRVIGPTPARHSSWGRIKTLYR